jgi:ribosomal protein S18 acetylase RimI-like enzyme
MEGLDAIVAEALPWVHEAGRPYYDWLFGGAEVARTVLARWMRRPTSEVYAGRVRLVREGERPVGGFLALSGRELADARRADALAVMTEFRAPGQKAVPSRLRQAGRIFVPVEADDFYLSKMGVNPTQRGRGRGRLVLEEYLEMGRARGLQRFRLDVWEGNEPALRLYRSAGFRELPTAAAEQDPDLRYVAMVLELAPSDWPPPLGSGA